MSPASRNLVVNEDMTIKGQIRNCAQLDVFGLVEGEVFAEKIVIHPGGRFYGTAKAHDAAVQGTLEGRVLIKNLIHIGDNGTVIGDVRYGRIAMDPGGNLSAELRNVPPEIFGDLTVEVAAGRAVQITTRDLTGFDPDDGAGVLVYSVRNVKHGYIKVAGGAIPAKTFTQQDLEAGRVSFVHDGSTGNSASFDVVLTDSQGATSNSASFDVVLTDSQGATSGAPQTVEVVVGSEPLPLPR